MRWKSRSRNVELFQAGSTDHIEDEVSIAGDDEKILVCLLQNDPEKRQLSQYGREYFLNDSVAAVCKLCAIRQLRETRLVFPPSSGLSPTTFLFWGPDPAEAGTNGT